MTDNARRDTEQARHDAARQFLAQMRNRTERAADAADAANEYDAQVAEWTLRQRLRTMDDDPNGLFFGSIDGPDGEFYVGRRHIEDHAGEAYVVDWRAPAATPFYRATFADPFDLDARLRHTIEDHEVVAVFEERFDDPDHHGGGGVPDPLIAELERLSPEIVTACRAALKAAQTDADFVRLDKAAFARAPSISIDYAVMERTELAAMVPVDMGWSDVGSWQALWEIGAKDHAGNVIVGDVLQIGAGNCYLRGDGILVAAIGLEDFVVIATKDAVLVAPKGESQEVRQIVDQLNERGRREIEQRADN